MRLAILALLIAAVVPRWADAFEIEDRRLFPPADGEGVTITVASTADLPVFAPLIEDFRARHPRIGVDYIVASTADIAEAVLSEARAFDLVLSSAMDLQIKIANDGLARPHRSTSVQALPDWARWRDHVFAFTREPAVLVLNGRAFDGLARPATRQALISLMRDHPERFRDRVGTYDVRESGLGYLFATQDDRNADAYWRLSEVMGRLGARFYCCSNEMIDDVISGDLAFAYNVLGSYAAARRAEAPGIEIVVLEDYANVMLRTALIPRSAARPGAAGRLLDYLVRSGNDPASGAPRVLPPLQDATNPDQIAFGPIRLGPALLAPLDRLSRIAFLREWVSAMEQD